MEKFTEAASLIISHSILAKLGRKTAVNFSDTTESPYNTKIAEFSVVFPEQSKFIEPVDTAILSTIPEGDPNLTIYLNELLRTNKPNQQNDTLGFRHPKIRAIPRIIPQFRRESLKSCVNCNRKKTKPRT